MRAAILAATRGVLLDIVVAGENRESCALLCWLNPAEAARISKTPAPDLTCDPLVVQFLKDRFQEYNETVGSSERVCSFSLLEDPPSMAAGEITDKAYVNQRAVLKHRSGASNGCMQSRRARRDGGLRESVSGLGPITPLLAGPWLCGLVERNPFRRRAGTGAGVGMNFLGRKRLAAFGAHHDRIEVLAAFAVLMQQRPPACVDHVRVTPVHDRHHDRIEIEALLREDVLMALGRLLIGNAAQARLAEPASSAALRANGA